MSIAFWCVLIAGFLPVVSIGLAKAAPGYDNANPREWLARQDGLRKRADFAHRNHFEAFPFFAAAVLVASFQHTSQSILDTLAVLFIVLRLAYTAAYLLDRATLRSVLWTLGYGVTVAIFILAARSG